MQPMNLLFLLFDDLRPELSIYNRNHMVTPNFERLSKHSVIFDKVFAQISVCNPSRDSLMTGLRPDSTGTYSFQSSYRPHLSIPMHLARSNYSTASFGKIFHWEIDDREIWTEELYYNDWYKYQNDERGWMNSTLFPDNMMTEDNFRDHDYTTHAISRLQKFIDNKEKHFMLSIGFKLPHLQTHIPYAYYEMYKNKTQMWARPKKELKFPASAPDVAYRCCAEPTFWYMRDEGRVKSTEQVDMGDINMVFSDRMYNELMWGYCGGITFVDKQLGRILDVLDQKNAWANTVVVLTSDHGHHNGEKGIWEKWSMFDESTRVPLLIAHPLSPYHGQHYKHPVELIDVYPTIVDLINLPFHREEVCKGKMEVGRENWDVRCLNLQGKSLARVVMGDEYYDQFIANSQNHANNFRRTSATDFRQTDLILKNYRNFASLNILAPTTSVMTGGIMDKNISLFHTAIDLMNKNRQKKKSVWNPVSNFRRLQASNVGNIEVAAVNATAQYTLRNTTKLSSISSTHRSLVAIANRVAPMAVLDQKFAISQSWRCAKMSSVKKIAAWQVAGREGSRSWSMWRDCDKTADPVHNDEVSIMGYSVRTDDFRYTAWFHYDRVLCLPRLEVQLFDEELYSHLDEKLEDFTHLEFVNLARRPAFGAFMASIKSQLIDFLRRSIVFRTCFRD